MSNNCSSQKKPIEFDKAGFVSGTANRSDLILPVIQQTIAGDIPKRIYASQFFPDTTGLRADPNIDFAIHTGSLWNVAEKPNIVFDLVDPINYLNTEGAVSGYIFQVLARQPLVGGKRLVLDGKEVPLQVVDNMAVGNTLVVGRYIMNELDIHTDPSVEALKPRILDQSDDQTVLEGTYANIFAKFIGADTTAIYREGATTPLSTRPATRIKVSDTDPATSGTYFIEATNQYGKTLSDPIFLSVGEPEAVSVASGPTGGLYSPGTVVTLEASFAGTPPPFKIETIVNDVVVNTTPNVSKISLDVTASTMTQTVVFKAYNKIPVTTTIPGENGDPDTTETTYEVKDASTTPVSIGIQKLTQVPPTNFVVNDNADTGVWTNASGKVSTDCEYRINGDAWAPVVTYPLPVGDRDLAAQSVEVRYAETDTHYASSIISNATAYYSSLQRAHVESPPATLTNMVASGADYTTSNTAQPNNRENYISFQGKKVYADFQGFYFETDVIVQDGAERTFIAAKKDNSLGDFPTMLAAMYLTIVGGLVYVRVITNGQDGQADFSEAIIPGGKIRFGRPALNLLTVVYSRDNWATSQTIHTFSSVDASGDLFIYTSTLTGNTLKNPFYYGLRSI